MNPAVAAAARPVVVGAAALGAAALGAGLLCKNSVLEPLLATLLKQMTPSIIVTCLLLGGAAAAATRVLPVCQSPVVPPAAVRKRDIHILKSTDFNNSTESIHTLAEYIVEKNLTKESLLTELKKTESYNGSSLGKSSKFMKYQGKSRNFRNFYIFSIETLGIFCGWGLSALNPRKTCVWTIQEKRSRRIFEFGTYFSERLIEKP